MLFQFFLLISIVNAYGQANCACNHIDFNKSEVNIELDSLLLFNKLKTLKASSNTICVFEALTLELEFNIEKKRDEEAYETLIKQEDILKTIDCSDLFLNQFYVNKANYYMLINDLDKLSEFGFIALSKSEEQKNKELELESLKAIIYLFMRLDRDAENWEYIKRAHDIIINLPENKSKASQYIWLAYEFENQYIQTQRKSLIDSSFIYANEAKKIARKYALNRELAQSYRANEAISYHKGDLKNALKYIDSAIYYGKKTKGVFNLSPFYIAKAWDLVDLGRLKEASKCIDTSLVIDNKNDLGFSANVWHEAKEIYGITGDTAKAYNSFKMYAKLKDSLLNIERIKSANDVEAKYKSELKDEKIKSLSFLLIIAIITIIIALLIFNLFRLRKEREKDKAIKLAYKQQLTLEKELANVRNTIAKDFHDDLGNKLAKITALSDLMTVKERTKLELKNALNTIKLDANELFDGTKDFMFSLKSDSDNLEEIITYLTDFATEFFNDLNIDFSLSIDVNKNVTLPSYWNRQIVLILKEAMTNTAKHSMCTKVILEISFSTNNLKIKLIDNGIGFDTQIDQKRGLLHMKQRASTINAELEITSNNKGTIVQLICMLPKEGSTIE